MKSVTLLDLFPTHGFSAGTPTQIQVPRASLDTPDASETRNYQFQASNGKIPNYSSNFSKRTHSLSQNQGTLISNDYSNVLHSVYKEEMCNDNNDNVHKLLIISVHAVFLESGFVCFDSVAGNKIDGFRLPMWWASKSTVDVQYTLPSLQDGAGAGAGAEMLDKVGLKFQTMGKFVYVHGAFIRNSPLGFVRLDASRFVPSINFMCRLNFGNEDRGSNKSFHERELYELWRITKDGLALPLLTDLCVKTGSEPPPCFTSLVPDFKLKILEFLPAIDLARVGCVSSELRNLSSNNDLWKQKFMEEFALSDSAESSEGDWKEKYLTAREREKRRKRVRRGVFRGGLYLRHG